MQTLHQESASETKAPGGEAETIVDLHGDTKELARQAAASEHMSLTAFVDMAVLKVADDVLSRHETCHLRDEDIAMLEEVFARICVGHRIISTEIIEFNNGGFDSEGLYF